MGEHFILSMALETERPSVVSHHPKMNAVWFGFPQLVKQECDMILNAGVFMLS